MFYLSEIEHTLRVPPHLLNLPLNEAIKGELEGLFLNKVLASLGLCVSVYDIHSIDGGSIFPGDGASTYTVKFRLIMFRPFVGEVIAAKLKESTENGLRLSLGFFYDIYVPAHLMPAPSHHVPDPEHKNQVKWIWDYGADENESSDAIEPSSAVEREEEIRFRVQDVTYQSIPIPKADQKEESKEIQKSKKFPPMLITGLLDADGLGPVGWWRDSTTYWSSRVLIMEKQALSDYTSQLIPPILK